MEEQGLPKEEGVYDLTIMDGRGIPDSVRWQFLEGTYLSGEQHYVDGKHYWADNYRGNPINALYRLMIRTLTGWLRA